ncbi:MAG: methenyltetrahydromethanopterin cyclohydrolase [Planctomycetaceae bacterium]|nr:methenyltetrahydromethanopterin cyclohydrolase [Planctomycetaceae bacterium]
MTDQLNRRAFRLAAEISQAAGELRVLCHELAGGGYVIDCGVNVEGGLAAGLALARTTLSGFAQVTLNPGTLAGVPCPQVQVVSDSPVEACLLSQYAGWQINVGDFFAMGSGPMRAAAGVEELFAKLGYGEDSECTVGVLETSRIPDDSVLQYIAAKAKVAAEHVTLLVAPTASQAGNIQIVSRSVETALHKLFELDFDVQRVRSAVGTAPLPPVAADDLTGIGRTNDAILYGARTVLYVTGDDESLEEIGPRVPSAASIAYGKPFVKIFEEADRDFYSIDPLLFSPAQVVFQNLATGRVHEFGSVREDILQDSFGY